MRDTDIAIVGMAGRFPAARDVDELWDGLLEGRDGVARLSDDDLRAAGVSRRTAARPGYVPAAGVLPDHVGLFDAGFFGMSPAEAQRTDPQQRLLLETAWEALERAGCTGEGDEQRTGVFVGGGISQYLIHNLRAGGDGPHPDFVGEYAQLLGNDKDFLSTRTSYALGLTGPSLTVQTACSTSLVAVHLACQSLLTDECELALAGGVSIRVPHRAGYQYQEGAIMAPDGRCRAFDADAQGTVPASGVALVVLARLADAVRLGCHVHAVIRGSAIGNDGAAKIGFTAPSADGQAATIAEALAVAEVEPDSVGYVEAHGTATALGDAVEIAGLRRAFGDAEDATCLIGSAKSNLGHLDAAAGVTGLIKAALAVEHGVVPPTIGFRRPNPRLELDRSRFRVAAERTEWRTEAPRRAGVSSFGIGGTNAHAVLEQTPAEALAERAPAPEAAVATAAPAAPPADGALDEQLLVLSARTPTALAESARRLAAHLEARPDAALADVAGTLQLGRRTLEHRAAVVARDAASAVARLREEPAACAAAAPSVAFVFPGQGTQRVCMGAALAAREPVFRGALDECCDLLAPELGHDLRTVLFPPSGEEAAAADTLAESATTQPALFAIEYALALQWRHWGVEPAAMLGHSVGELVAACLADVMSLPDALRLVATRGRLMQAMERGAMVAVRLSPDELEPYLGDGLTLAAVNAERATVVAGDLDAVAAVEARFAADEVVARRLVTSHAFHSPSMEPAAAQFAAAVAGTELRPPRIPFISNVTGTWIADEECCDPAYWGRQLRAPVRFGDGAAALVAAGHELLLEVGPGHALTNLLRGSGARVLPALDKAGTPAERAVMLEAAGALWAAGVDVDFARLHEGRPWRRTALPTYPFERALHWIGPGADHEDEDDDESAATNGRRFRRSGEDHERAIVRAWRAVLGVESADGADDFFALGGDSLVALQLVERLRESCDVELSAQDLIEAPTLEALTALVAARRAGAAARSPLVRMTQRDGAAPFVCVHPAGGTVVLFMELARRLAADCSFFAIQSPGAYGDPDPPTIEAAAECYLAELRTAQPDGPYRLGGYSFGGNVAYEMARRLRADGADVASLVLIDAHAPDAYPPDRAPSPGAFLAAFPQILGLYAGRTSTLHRDRLLELEPDAALDYAIHRLRADGVLPPGVDDAAARGLFATWRHHFDALRAYDPPAGGLDLPLTLLTAHDGQPAELLDLLGLELPDVEDQGWARYTTGEVTVGVVPGNHYTLFGNPHVASLADAVRQALAAAETPSLAP